MHSIPGFRDLIETNLTGYFLVARGFSPLMIEQGNGRIINISMNHETMKRKGFVPYGPSRAATESLLSAIMAEDLKDLVFRSTCCFRAEQRRRA